MKSEFYLHFDEGMPSGTAQQKGERIGHKYDPKKKKVVPYVEHYVKPKLKMLRTQLMYMMKRYRPEKPSDKPIRLTMIFYCDIKSPKKLWGKYKTTRPDVENFYKEIADIMTSLGFWSDDSQIVDLHLKKYYAEKATIYIKVEELEDGPT